MPSFIKFPNKENPNIQTLQISWQIPFIDYFWSAKGFAKCANQLTNYLSDKLLVFKCVSCKRCENQWFVRPCLRGAIESNFVTLHKTFLCSVKFYHWTKPFLIGAIKSNFVTQYKTLYFVKFYHCTNVIQYVIPINLTL